MKNWRIFTAIPFRFNFVVLERREAFVNFGIAYTKHETKEELIGGFMSELWFAAVVPIDANSSFSIIDIILFLNVIW